MIIMQIKINSVVIMFKLKNKAQEKGFALIEIITVIAVASILMLFGIPKLSDYLKKTRANTKVQELAHAVQLARSEALSAGSVVTLCKSGDLTSCGGDWSEGYMIFIDRNANHQVDAEDEILHTWLGNADKEQIRWRGFPSKNYLQFDAMGIPHNHNGSFYYCPRYADASFGRALFISKSGRIRFSQDTDGDGIHEDSQGRPLVCDNTHYVMK
jgi:type IV fimbrial biogenesis protein FimT